MPPLSLLKVWDRSEAGEKGPQGSMLGVSPLFPLRVPSDDTCLQPWGLDSASLQLSSQSALRAASLLNNLSYPGGHLLPYWVPTPLGGATDGETWVEQVGNV